MDGVNKKDLKINGIMSIPGGEFNNIKVNGMSELTSDVDCNDFYVNGMVTANGKVKAVKVKINGTANFKGDVEIGSLNILGKSEVLGESKISDLKIEGEMNISKNLVSENISIFGSVKIKGNCNSEVFKSKGAFAIDGLLNAGNIDIELHGKCSANEIGGEKIRVVKGADYNIKKFIKSIFSSFDLFDGKLKTNIIEGDEIYLENTIAKIVRGDRVEIGPNCDIEIVEFKNKFKKSENTVVNEYKKI